MQTSDLELMLNLQRLALLLWFLVDLAIIVGVSALCFIAGHTASIRSELLKLRINAEMASERFSKKTVGR